MSSQKGITFKISDKKPEVFNGGALTAPVDLIKATWEAKTKKDDWRKGRLQYSKCKELLQSSLPHDPKEMSHIVPTNNGFVDTVMTAYNRHHNLVIRPDDIWIAILSQLNIYVNAHAEELRSFFVSHEGKKRLQLRYDGTRRSMDYRIAVNDFAALLKENINDPTLYDLILPGFSTTTPHDTTTCAIVMMSTLKSYFEFRMIMMLCGIPKITLLGTKGDYENILERVRRLRSLEMGAEPRAFAALLQPIIRQFIAVFDAVANNSTEPKIDMDFWSRMCHRQSFGSGESQISGWITAFCVWIGTDATWNGPSVDELTYTHNYHKSTDQNQPWWHKRLVLDGMEYPRIGAGSVPSGLCEAEVEVNDNGKKLNCMVIAGHMATRVVISTTIAPAPVWFMFEKEDVVETYEPPEWAKGRQEYV